MQTAVFISIGKMAVCFSFGQCIQKCLYFSVRSVMAKYWIILINCLKPDDQMTLEAGSIVVVLKEECLAQEKWFSDKIPASIEVNENITTESIQHSIYYLPTLHGCAHTLQPGPTIVHCIHLLIECQTNLGLCHLFWRNSYEGTEGSSANSCGYSRPGQLGGQHWIQLQKVCPRQTVLKDI